VRLSITACALLAGCDGVFGLGDPALTASIEFVQARCVQSDKFRAAVPLDVTLTTTAGDLLVIAVNITSSTDNPPEVTFTMPTPNGIVTFPAAHELYFRILELYVWPDVPGGDLTIEATPFESMGGPGDLCVSEYAGASTADLTVTKSKGGAVLTDETVNGVMATLDAHEFAYLAIVDRASSVITPALPGLSTRNFDGRMLVADTASSFAPGDAIAVVEAGSGSSPPDQWGMATIVLQAP
jgi:hypothetical protein